MSPISSTSVPTCPQCGERLVVSPTATSTTCPKCGTPLTKDASGHWVAGSA